MTNTHKFKPGQSGNPAGRPPGRTATAKLHAAIAGDMPDIIRSLVNAAKVGDVQASKVLLDRIYPTLKQEGNPVSLPKAMGSLSNKADAVTSAALSGKISPDAGNQLMKILADQAKMQEAQDIINRIEALERRYDEN
jgi:hypothetical protein